MQQLLPFCSHFQSSTTPYMPTLFISGYRITQSELRDGQTQRQLNCRVEATISIKLLIILFSVQ